jgi:hypothetical protein
MGEGGLAVVRLPREETLGFQDACAREGRLGLPRRLAHLAVGPAGRAREPQAVPAHDAQPRLDVVLIEAASERARRDHHRLAVAQEPEQRIRLREGETGRFLGGAEPPRPAHRGQRVRVAPFGQGGPCPHALRFSAPAEHGRAFRCRLAHRILLIHSREARSVCGPSKNRIARCHSSAECHSARVVYFRACAS